jgi:dTDP-glucose pyrophosphorylase
VSNGSTIGFGIWSKDPGNFYSNQYGNAGQWPEGMLMQAAMTLGSLTLAHSKAMTPVLGAPVIQRVLEPFARNGCRDFVVVASPEDEALISWAERFRADGLELRLAFQKERKGTAHAIGVASDVMTEDFVCVNGDIIVTAETLRSSSRPAGTAGVAS